MVFLEGVWMNLTWNTRRILIIIIIIRFSNNEYDFFGTKGSCQKPHFHLKLGCVRFLFGLPGFPFSQLTLINTSIFHLLWSIPQIHCSIHYEFLSFIKSYKTYKKQLQIRTVIAVDENFIFEKNGVLGNMTRGRDIHTLSWRRTSEMRVQSGYFSWRINSFKQTFDVWMSICEMRVIFAKKGNKIHSTESC